MHPLYVAPSWVISMESFEVYFITLIAMVFYGVHFIWSQYVFRVLLNSADKSVDLNGKSNVITAYSIRALAFIICITKSAIWNEIPYSRCVCVCINIDGIYGEKEVSRHDALCRKTDTATHTHTDVKVNGNWMQCDHLIRNNVIECISFDFLHSPPLSLPSFCSPFGEKCCFSSCCTERSADNDVKLACHCNWIIELRT